MKKQTKEYRVKTPRQLKYSPLTEQDMLFCHLVVILGYPQSVAYSYAYRNKAKACSNAALSCRRLKDMPILDYCNLLRKYFELNQLEPTH